MSRRALTAEDLDRLAEAQCAAGEPPPVYRELERVSAATIGHRLFTIMRFDPGRAEVERVHSSDMAVYPVGGRKTKHDTPWSDRVLGAGKSFLATTADDIRSAFDDCETIFGLGIGSILNIPVLSNGRCVGTMNLCHETGWYRTEDERVGLTLAPYLLPALLKV